MLTCDCGTTDHIHYPDCIALDDDYDTGYDIRAEALAADGYYLPKPHPATTTRPIALRTAA